MIFDSTSLPQSKNVFQKKCLSLSLSLCVCVCMYVCVCVRVCVCLSVRPSPIVELKAIDDLVQIRYLGSFCKYIEPFFFSFSSTPKIKGSSHEKKYKKMIFFKNGFNDFD